MSCTQHNAPISSHVLSALTKTCMHIFQFADCHLKRENFRGLEGGTAYLKPGHPTLDKVLQLSIASDDNRTIGLTF